MAKKHVGWKAFNIEPEFHLVPLRIKNSRGRVPVYFKAFILTKHLDDLQSRRAALAKRTKKELHLEESARRFNLTTTFLRKYVREDLDILGDRPIAKERVPQFVASREAPVIVTRLVETDLKKIDKIITQNSTDPDWMLFKDAVALLDVSPKMVEIWIGEGRVETRTAWVRTSRKCSDQRGGLMIRTFIARQLQLSSADVKGIAKNRKAIKKTRALPKGFRYLEPLAKRLKVPLSSIQAWAATVEHEDIDVMTKSGERSRRAVRSTDAKAWVKTGKRLSRRALAGELGVSPSTLARRIKQDGWPFPEQNTFAPEDVSRIRKYLTTGNAPPDRVIIPLQPFENLSHKIETHHAAQMAAHHETAEKLSPIASEISAVHKRVEESVVAIKPKRRRHDRRGRPSKETDDQLARIHRDIKAIGGVKAYCERHGLSKSNVDAQMTRWRGRQSASRRK